MLPEKYVDEQQKRIRKLNDFVDIVENDIFSEESLKGLSMEKVYERYVLAKNALGKEIDTALKIAKDDNNMPAETKLLLGLVMSLTSEEKKKVREAIIQIKKSEK